MEQLKIHILDKPVQDSIAVEFENIEELMDKVILLKDKSFDFIE